ncbi:MAG: hypothetical protein MI725_05075 [Pirellulales bacterium]|nr:hypothetical protein [Pirellulales bacterium]
MSTSLPPSTELVVPESSHREFAADFVRWALAQLQIDLSEKHGIGHIRLAEQDRAAFDGQAEIRLALENSTSQQTIETLDWDGKFGRWLLDRLRAGGPALHLRPGEHPTAVNDISERLFDAYQVEGGRVHLGGCQLTDMPFLRLSFSANDHGQRSLRHVFVAHDGSSVSDELAEKLNLHNLQRIDKLPPRISERSLNTLIGAGRHIAAKMSTLRDPTAVVVEPVLLSLVWIKHASGQLHFTIGDTTATLPFSGWAKLIEPQPFVAKQSGASTFHLAATDDGCIDAFEQIATCQQSGRRVLLQDLVTCSVTEKQVLAEYTQACPVSGKPALSNEFANCSVCLQSVSKAVLEGKVCQACRGLVKIRKDDPRLVWILGEHTGLERWKSWKLAETEHVYIAQASSMLKQLLVVVDKETLAVHRVAAADRLRSSWLPLSDAEADEML